MANFQGFVQGQSQTQGVSVQTIQLGTLMHANQQNLSSVITQILTNNVFLEDIHEVENEGDVLLDEQGQENDYDYGIADLFSQATDAGGINMSGDGPAAFDIPDDRKSYLAVQFGLQDDLMEQLKSFLLTEEQQEIGMKLIESLDARGFFTHYQQAEEYLVDRLSYSQNSVHSTLKQLRSKVEPAGMFAINEQDFFRLQVDRIKGKELKATLSMIVEHRFEELINKKLNDLKAFLRVDSMEMVNDVYNSFLELKPVPSLEKEPNLPASYQRRETDFIVTVENDFYTARLNEKTELELKKNMRYAATLATLRKEDRIKDPAYVFLRKQEQEFNLVKDQLEQRRKKLEQVVSEVLNIQKDFLVSGDPDKVLPLLQKDVAAKFDLDPSTVSRIMNEKLIQMEGRAPFFMGELFSRRTVTIEYIKDKINELILTENHDRPRTNVELEAELKKHGLIISSSLVGKICKSMKIPDSRERKSIYVNGRENNNPIDDVLKRLNLKKANKEQDPASVIRQLRLNM